MARKDAKHTANQFHSPILQFSEISRGIFAKNVIINNIVQSYNSFYTILPDCICIISTCVNYPQLNRISHWNTTVHHDEHDVDQWTANVLRISQFRLQLIVRILWKSHPPALWTYKKTKKIFGLKILFNDISLVFILW